MSDANLAAIAFRPSGTHNFKALRYTGEDLKFNKETAQSQEIRDDGQIPDLAKVGGQPEGGFNFELSFFALQPFLAAILRNNWQVLNLTVNATLTLSTQRVTAAAATFAAIQVGQIVKIAGATNPLNNGPKRVVGKATDGSYLTLAAGSLVDDAASASLTFTGKSVSNAVVKLENDFEKRIVNSAGEDFFLRYMNMVADTMELRIESKRIVTGNVKFIGQTYDIGDDSEDPQGAAGVKASGVLTFTDQPEATETVTIQGVVYTFQAGTITAAGQVQIGGTLAASITALVAAIMGTDGVNDVHPYVTAVGNATTVTVTAKVFGTGPNSYTTTDTVADATWGAATLTGGITQVSGYEETDPGDVMNGTNNMGTIRMDGAAATDRFKSITLNFANNCRGKDALGFEGNFDVGLGTIAVTGSLNAYFLNNQLPAKIKAHTSFSLDFYMEDSAGNRLYFYFPNVKPSNGDPTISGINTDVMIETGFQAILDRANGTLKTVIIDAIPAA